MEIEEWGKTCEDTHERLVSMRRMSKFFDEHKDISEFFQSPTKIDQVEVIRSFLALSVEQEEIKMMRRCNTEIQRSPPEEEMKIDSAPYKLNGRAKTHKVESFEELFSEARKELNYFSVPPMIESELRSLYENSTDTSDLKSTMIRRISSFHRNTFLRKRINIINITDSSRANNMVMLNSDESLFFDGDIYHQRQPRKFCLEITVREGRVYIGELPQYNSLKLRIQKETMNHGDIFELGNVEVHVTMKNQQMILKCAIPPDFKKTLYPKEDFSIGKSNKSSYTITHDSVSKEHAFCTKENETWFISDQNSTNGIFKRVSHCEIEMGSIFSFNSVLYQVSFSS